MGVPVCNHISETKVQTSSNFYACCLWSWLGYLLRHCNTLCTSFFVDDVIFSHNGLYDTCDKNSVRAQSNSRGGSIGPASGAKSDVYSCLVRTTVAISWAINVLELFRALFMEPLGEFHPKTAILHPSCQILDKTVLRMTTIR